MVNMKLKPVDQQVVVVTGATSGIGRAAALLFAKKGAKVVVSGRDTQELETLVEEIRKNGGHATPISADVADFEQVKELADKTADIFGRIDTWVHTPGVMMYATFEETKPEEFKRMIEVNLLGQIYGAKAALPYLKRGEGGALIHISSIESVRALPYQSAYAASKHGMVGFMDALRLELKEEGSPVAVTNIKPAGINTPLYDKALTRLGVKPRPVPPIYKPEDAAKAILYAAQHPVRELAVGGAGKALAVSQRISPKLADRTLMNIAFRGQKTDKPKSPQAPHNLYHHLEGFDQVKGSFSDEERSMSVYTRLASSTLAKAVLGVAAVAGVVFLSGRVLRSYTRARRQSVWDRISDKFT
jgi:NAD(P)-dependent dehydrogenase (short-subunit alcohol dehydrogenase family)